MLHGVPVVATPIAAEGAVDDSGPDVFALVTDDPERLADRIVELLGDEQRARAIGQRAQDWELGHYSLERLA
jgi:hypothetical protein